MFANIPYSQLKNAFFYRGQNMQKMVFYFENTRKRTKEIYEKATVHVTLDQDFHVSRFDVELDSIPGSGVDGFELTPTFDALNLDNNQTFYTDSNGLEMQKRILNYRSYYNFTEDWKDASGKHPQHNQNISSNWYPVNSAITLKEGNRQFTVLNDRSQGGASLQKGRIELMQHRRVPADDNKGVAEYLNEKDPDGKGIRVPASYFVQFGSVEEGSIQRRVQSKIDDPLQFMFTQDLKESTDAQVDTDFDLSSELVDAGVTDLVKMITVPMAKGKFMLRLQNIADHFDADAETKSVNKSQVIEALWKAGNIKNKDLEMGSYSVTETSVTGNQPLTDMNARRLSWKTVDDASLVKKDLDFSEGDIIKLEPQRIRVFLVEFTN